MNIDLSDANVQESPKAPDQKAQPALIYDDGDAVMQLDNSGLSTYLSCPRKFEYNRIKKRSGSTGVALVFGSSIHDGLEYVYNQKGAGLPVDEREMLLASLKAWDGFTVAMGEWRTPERSQDTLKRYLRHYEDETLQIMPFEDGPAVELPFSLGLGAINYNDTIPRSLFSNPEDLPNDDPTVKIKRINIYWIGKIDLAVIDDGFRLISDHKTTSRIGSSYWRKHETSPQMKGYCWAINQLLDEPVVGCMINCIAGRKPTKTGVGTEFARQRFFYSPESIEEWKHNTLALVDDLVFNFKRGLFPMNTNNCEHMYGPCEYTSVCGLPQCQREEMLSSDLFVDNVWSPLNE